MENIKGIAENIHLVIGFPFLIREVVHLACHIKLIKLLQRFYLHFKGVSYPPSMVSSFGLCIHDALELAKQAIARAEGK